MPHICVSESGQHWLKNGLSPIQRQAIIWTDAGLLSIGPLGNFSQNTKLFIHENGFENIFYEMATIFYEGAGG